MKKEQIPHVIGDIELAIGQRKTYEIEKIRQALMNYVEEPTDEPTNKGYYIVTLKSGKELIIDEKYVNKIMEDLSDEGNHDDGIQGALILTEKEKESPTFFIELSEIAAIQPIESR